LLVIGWVVDACAMQQQANRSSSACQVPVYELEKLPTLKGEVDVVALANLASPIKFPADSRVEFVDRGANNDGVYFIEANSTHDGNPKPLVLKFLCNQKNSRSYIKGYIECVQAIARHDFSNNFLCHFVQTKCFIVGKHKKLKYVIEVMEKAPGVSLCAVLRDERLSINQKKQVCAVVGKALARMHKENLVQGAVCTVVHGDLNPANIHIDGELVVFIDAASLAYSVACKQSIGWDFAALLMVPFLYWKWITAGKEFFDPMVDCMCCLLKNYICAFESGERAEITSHLVFFIKLWLDVAFKMMGCADENEKKVFIERQINSMDSVVSMHLEYKDYVQAAWERFPVCLKETKYSNEKIKERLISIQKMFIAAVQVPQVA